MARAPALQETEVLPEADRLEGFPHPRETRALFGHERAERELAAAFASGRMHHGWLLAGPEGIGKATLVYRLATHVLARPEERQGGELGIPAHSSAARQVMALSHPGLLVLRRPYDTKSKRFAASLPIDEVRRLKSFLGLTSGKGQWRVVIVDTADDLNINAANALLKSLEEPPARALFLLISSEPGRLLPTIRSRCRRFDLSPLGEADLRCAVEAALATAGSDPPNAEQWPRLVRLAQGSVRRALQLFGNGGLELQAEIEKVFEALPRVDWTAAHTLADGMSLAAQEQRFEAFFDLFLDQLAGLIRARAKEQGEASDVALAQRLIPPASLPAWAALWETIVRERAETRTLNLDRKALVLGTLARLESATRIPLPLAGRG